MKAKQIIKQYYDIFWKIHDLFEILQDGWYLSEKWVELSKEIWKQELQTNWKVETREDWINNKRKTFWESLSQEEKNHLIKEWVADCEWNKIY